VDPTRKRALLAMCGATMIWGINFSAAKYATQQFDPFFIAAVRILIAAPVLFLLVPAAGKKEIFRPGVFRTFLPLSLTGILINQVCFIKGIESTTPGHSAILMSLIPIFVALFAFFFLKEKLPLLGWIGILLGATGSVGVILSGTSIETSALLQGDGLILLGTLAFSLYTVWGRHAIQKHGPSVVTAGAYLGAAIFAPLLLVYSLGRQEWSAITWGGIASLAYLVIFTTIICYTLYFWALARLKAAQVAVFADGQPIIGTTISVLIGFDLLSPLFVGAGLITLLGIIFVQFQPRTRLNGQGA